MSVAIGSVIISNNLLLAPIAGYCDLAFRRVVRSVPGVLPDSPTVGLACTDLLCPQAILNPNEKTAWLAATCPEDRPLCMQLYGAHAASLAEAAAWAATPLDAGGGGADVVDLNMGCPVDKVTKRNGGSTLLCDPPGTVKLAAAVVRAVERVASGRVPVTAKIRLGWDDGRIITQTLPPMLADAGIAAVTVHGRTTEQKFRGQARWQTGGLDCIAAVVEGMARRHPDVPVFGNGDVKTPEDAKRMLDLTGCAGVMIGRGALGQPWLFRDTAYYLATGDHAPPLSRAERVAVILRHFDLLREYRGERAAAAAIPSRMSWYRPHLQPWPGLKAAVQGMRSVEELRVLLLNGPRPLPDLPEQSAGNLIGRQSEVVANT